MTVWAIQVQHRTDFDRNGKWYELDRTNNADYAVQLWDKYAAPIKQAPDFKIGAYGRNGTVPARPVRIIIVGTDTPAN